jgi:hypothetical protein
MSAVWTEEENALRNMQNSAQPPAILLELRV